MSVRLYNTMTHQKEKFQPREKGKVAMYVCGPTTYNFFHVGNGRTLVAFDMIRRYLIYKGFAVTFVQNFTDVDDKIIKRGREEGMEPLALARKYIDEYYQDAKALNLLPATIHPKATEHIEEMIQMIKGLEVTGLAYPVDGDVYFAVEQFAGYGKLSGRSLEDMLAGARVEVDERKRYPMDFALWKRAKPGEPAWASPWGMGRPGWHIECSAMSLKYLGVGFDIHGGGGDLVFPHHENEIAQTEGYLKEGYMARYWMHTAFLTVNQEKMSKSLGNFFTVRDILKKFPGEVIRFYLLGTHYRSQLDFDDEKLVMAQKGLERLRTSVQLADEVLQKSGDKPAATGAANQELRLAAQEAKAAFEKAMDDDFNSALAYAALFDLVKLINSHVADPILPLAGLREAQATLLELAGVLGFDLRQGATAAQDESKLHQVMDIMLQVRGRARQKKDWETSDFIRDALKEIGVAIEDTPQGTRWKVKGS